MNEKVKKAAESLTYQGLAVSNRNKRRPYQIKYILERSTSVEEQAILFRKHN